MKRMHILLGLCLFVAAMLALFGDKTPVGAISEPAQATTQTMKTPVSRIAPHDEGATRTGAANLRHQRDTPGDFKANQALLVVKHRHQLIDHGTKTDRNLFDPHSWAPPAPPPPRQISLPPPPSKAPPLPFTYLGKQKQGAQWQVFLARNNSTFIVSEQEIFDRHYRVESIAPPGMTIKYLPLNQLQTLKIE